MVFEDQYIDSVKKINYWTKNNVHINNGVGHLNVLMISDETAAF